MPSAMGYNDLKNVIRLPQTWDLAYLRQFNFSDPESGARVSFDDLVRNIGAGLTGFNASLTSQNNYWTRYLSLTTDLGMEYDTGGDASGLQIMSEYNRADPIRGDSTGHMLPMKDYGGAIGYTYLSIRRGTNAKLLLPVKRVIERGYNTWERAILSRLFSGNAETVGGTGVSVPFADGGVADSRYIPGSYAGKQFNAGHTHYLVRADSPDGRAAAAQDMYEHLREHGKVGPFELVIPEVDLQAWSALNGTQATPNVRFIKPERTPILTSNIEVRAVVDETYVGILEVDRGYFRVYAAPRLATDFAGAFAPQGFNAPDNPLKVRYEPGYELGLTMVADVKHYPLEDAQMLFTFGVGVGDRLSGVCTQFKGSGGYDGSTAVI